MSKLSYADNKIEAFQVMIPGEGLSHFVTFTNVSGYTANLEASTSVVELFSTEDCWVRLLDSTSNDVASIPAAGDKTGCFFVPGGIVTFFGIPVVSGVIYKFAVIRNSADGNLYVQEGA